MSSIHMPDPKSLDKYFEEAFDCANGRQIYTDWLLAKSEESLK